MAASHWIDEERVFDSVVALTEDVVYVANPKAEVARAMREALDSGEPASSVVKDDATVIPVGTILKVSYNRHDDDIDISWKAGKESESKNISFSSSQERDAFAAQLSDSLTDFEPRVVEYGPIRAALGPLGFGAFAGFMTWLLHMAAVGIVNGEEADFSGRRSGLKHLVYALLDLVGPIGVLVVGGLVLGLTGWVLVSRVKTPPIMHIMKRKS